MNTIKNVLEAIYSDDGLRDELSLIYSLSQPMLAVLDGRLSVQLFIYQSIPFEENSEVCYGEIICGLKDEFMPEVIFKKINHKLNAKDTLSSIDVALMQMSSIKDRKRIEQIVVDSLEKMRDFCFKDASQLSAQEIEITPTYISALKSLSSVNMLKIYNAVNPSFFDWCASVIKLGNKAH